MSDTIDLSSDADVCTSLKSFRRAAPSGVTTGCTADQPPAQWVAMAPTPAARTGTSATDFCGQRRRTRGVIVSKKGGKSPSKVRALMHVFRSQKPLLSDCSHFSVHSHAVQQPVAQFWSFFGLFPPLMLVELKFWNDHNPKCRALLMMTCWKPERRYTHCNQYNYNTLLATNQTATSISNKPKAATTTAESESKSESDAAVAASAATNNQCQAILISYNCYFIFSISRYFLRSLRLLHSNEYIELIALSPLVHIFVDCAVRWPSCMVVKYNMQRSKPFECLTSNERFDTYRIDCCKSDFCNKNEIMKRIFETGTAAFK